MQLGIPCLTSLDTANARSEIFAANYNAGNTELVDIRNNLWKPDDLRRLIDERHDQKCATCPAKKIVDESLQAAASTKREQPQGAIPWLINLMGNNSFQFFILLLFLIAAFVYLTTGKGGVDAARETLSTVVSGGAK